MRKFALLLEEQKVIGSPDAYIVGETGTQFCTACRKLFCDILEIDENQLHCCLKTMVKTENGEERVATWARSIPFDGRSDDDDHPIEGNTVWCSLLGRDDGINRWPLVHSFCSNDLPKNSPLFQCSRNNWGRFYKSTLVFPLRYRHLCSKNLHDTIGFLAFDSPKTGVFKEMPDIFEYREDITKYQDLCTGTLAFHAGAAIADTLSMFLRPTAEKQNHELH